MPGFVGWRARRSVAGPGRRRGQELATARLGWDRACLAELDVIAPLCTANLRRASPDLLNPQFRQDRKGPCISADNSTAPVRHLGQALR